jgi:hypothetical protein
MHAKHLHEEKNTARQTSGMENAIFKMRLDTYWQHIFIEKAKFEIVSG